MSDRPALAEVRAVVRTWSEARQFEWAERAAIVAEACRCDQAESEIRAFEMMAMVRRQMTLRLAQTE